MGITDHDNNNNLLLVVTITHGTNNYVNEMTGVPMVYSVADNFPSRTRHLEIIKV
jgi:hypothetical protein